MASRFWRGGSGTWDDTNTANWSATSGGAGGASVPTASDAVFVNANSGGGTITIGTGAACQSLDCTGAPATTIAFGSNTLNIQRGLTFVANITPTGQTTGTIQFNASANNGGAGWAITTAGKTMPFMTFNGSGGMWTLQDALTLSRDITINLGTFKGNAKTISCRSILSSGTGTRTIDITNCSVTCTSANQAWNLQDSTNLTLTATGSTLTISNVEGGFQFTGYFGSTALTYGSVVFSGSGDGNQSLGGSGALTFANLTRTGGAGKLPSFSIQPTSITVTGTFTANGNSAINRLVIGSSVPGTACTITAAAVSTSYSDWRDITAAGAANWNLSAITGNSGDAGGNTGITFTAAATQTWQGTAGGNWSANAWTTRVPLPQDNVVVSQAFVAAQTITLDMPRLGKNIDFTGTTGAPTLASATTNGIFGSLTLASGILTSGTNTLQLWGRTSSYTITSAGVTFTWGLQIAVGNYTFADAFATNNNNSFGPTLPLAFQVVNGGIATFSSSTSWAGTNSGFQISAGCTLNMGTGTWTFSATAAQTIISASGTVHGSSSTMTIATATSSTRTISGTLCEFGTFNYIVSGSSGALAITGSNSWTAFNFYDANASRQLILEPGKQQEITTANAWNVYGSATNYVYIPGATGSYGSSPDSVATSIVSDIDLRALGAADNWADGLEHAVLSKWGAAGQRSYTFTLLSDGKLKLYWTTDGTTQLSATSTVSVTTVGFANGVFRWIRAVLDVDNGAAGRTIRFYYSTDGTTWNQLGADVVQGTVTSIFDSTASVEMGSLSTGTFNWLGKIKRVQIRNGIAGTIAFDANPEAVIKTGGLTPNTFVESSANAATVTMNGTGWYWQGNVGIVSSTPGTQSNLLQPAGSYAISDYLTIQDSNASTGKWRAKHSVNVSNNTGWVFPTGRMSVWTGAAWVPKPIYDSAGVEKEVQFYDGNRWLLAT